MNRRVNWAIAVIVVGTLATPGLGLLLGIDPAGVSPSEMRELTAFPPWTWERDALATWPQRFQAYFNDRFAFRTRLIEWRAALLWHVLGMSASDSVIAGRDGWLFYADDGGVDDYIQREPLTPRDLEAWRETLERTQRWLASRGISYLVVFAPDKQMIYPELMPRTLGRLRPEYRLDQLLAYLGEGFDAEVLDLRPSLVAGRSREPLYYKYDTHWNDRGALIGYRTILERLAPRFPRLRPLDRDQFVAVAGVPSGDPTSMLGLVDREKLATPGFARRHGRRYRVVEPERPDPYGEDGRLVTEIEGSDLPRLVMFRDSFAGRLVPYLSEHFSRAVYVWQNDFDWQLVERERPDVVIQQHVARHLYTYGPYPPLVPDP